MERSATSVLPSHETTLASERMNHYRDTHGHRYRDSQCGNRYGIPVERAPEMLGCQTNHPARTVHHAHKKIHGRRHEQREPRNQKTN
jgi:hypothetical protein